jgi:hypothetical protein
LRAKTEFKFLPIENNFSNKKKSLTRNQVIHKNSTPSIGGPTQKKIWAKPTNQKLLTIGGLTPFKLIQVDQNHSYVIHIT